MRSAASLLVCALMVGTLPAAAQTAAPAAAPAAPNVIAEVRAAIGKGDFTAGERILAAYRKD